MNRELIIIKTGNTFPATLKAFGDFDEWIRLGLGIDSDQVIIVDIEGDDHLPPPNACRGVVIAGSHAMVTDNLPWIPPVAAWISKLIGESVPVLGICFGHQLIAQSMGGEVDYHPAGKEIGTVDIDLLPESNDDQLFRSLPRRFRVHVAHAQTVSRLPSGAVRLAQSSFEENHAFRLGKCAWGVQFHPEFDARIMDSYVSVQASELEASEMDVSAIRASIKETPVAKEILRRFAGLVLQSESIG